MKDKGILKTKQYLTNIFCNIDNIGMKYFHNIRIFIFYQYYSNIGKKDFSSLLPVFPMYRRYLKIFIGSIAVIFAQYWGQYEQFNQY